jgi:hypothetical protein
MKQTGRNPGSGSLHSIFFVTYIWAHKARVLGSWQYFLDQLGGAVTLSIMTFSINPIQHNNIQYYDTQHNNIQHNDTQHKYM